MDVLRLLRVALATCAEIPGGDDDAPLADRSVLAARDVDALPAVWDDDGVETGRSSTSSSSGRRGMDCCRHAFLSWAERRRVRPQAPEVLRWNTDKQYLATLGLETVPTTFLEPEEEFVVPDTPFVVKPSVGAGSIEAARYDAVDERARDHVRRLHATGTTVMVQPFLEAVDHAGEIALHFLGGEFSHAVRKAAMLPRRGEPGGGALRRGADQRGGAFGRRAQPGAAGPGRGSLEREDLLYARVDLLPGPIVLEVELTEPSLYLAYSAGAAERFADAITRRASRER